MNRQPHAQRYTSLFLLFALLLPVIPLSIMSSTNAAPDDPAADNEIFLPVVMNPFPPYYS